jgi:hypothetical protein
MMLDDDEPLHLLRYNAPSRQVAAPSPRNYLELRHPAEPLWPESGDSTYRLEGLSSDRRANLVRHNPAVGITSFPYNVFVFPQGNVQLRSLDEAHDVPSISAAEVNWVPYNDGLPVPSSYHQERTGLHPLSVVNQSSHREALIQSAVNDQAIVNPMEDIPGLGELDFLSQWDRLEAERRGYATAQEVSLARRRGDLAVGTGTNAGPIVVFRPEVSLLNPVEQPQGPGAWRFLTSDGETSNANLADIQFGGTRGLPRHPSARQIRRLGELYIQMGLTNLAAQIDIVWVPGAEDNEVDFDIALSEVDLPEEQDEGQQRPQTPPSVAIIPGQVSPHHNPAGLPVDRTNNGGVRGGVHDQTGGEWAEYQTMSRHGGRIITIDRSRAWHDHPEPHKLMVYSSRGWRKWGHANDMDWKDELKVAKLNKHREQTHTRAKWPALRDVKREDYTPEELKYVMDAVKAAGGERPKMDMEKLTVDFHRRFPQRVHTETGLQSLTDRLRKEYEVCGGLKPRKKRGWKQLEESKASRSAAEAAVSKSRVNSEDDGEDDGEGEGEGEGEGGEGGEVEDAEGEEVGEDGDEDLAEGE